jgi:D-glycero-D-manno-heptose 1,7-bisphosphate phosphatase
MTLVDAGLWCQIGPGTFADRPALFLDRDGVVVVDTNYLGQVEDLRMIAGSAGAIARCNALGIPIVLVTNQSGIARGYYDWNAFQAVQGAISEALIAAGAHLDAVLACAYHGEGHEPLRLAGHPWRKPNPGMIIEAATRMSLDLSKSWIIGDKPDDLAAGLAAGLAGGTLLSVDDNERLTGSVLAGRGFMVETAANLAGAVAGLIECGRLADGVSC